MPSRSDLSGSSLFPAQESSNSAPSPTSSSNTGWISAHCDGGARGNPGPAGYGALIQSTDGVIAELSEFLGLRTNNFAEYSGLLGCLDFALKNGYRKLRVVSDSELMVKQIQGKYQVKSPDLRPLYDEAKRRIAQLDGFEISHALRHKNKDADRLANEAMDRGMRKPGAAPAPSIRTAPAAAPAARPATPPIPIATPERRAAAPTPDADAMLRGFTRDGVVHILGGAKLPDGIFVKIIRE
ncbi:MAG TPA: ribonuclease HI family protein [Granulicella sp.]|jgi:probable phosphoglycerate mutase|nr:ribonuclease HI family protein [Granulicella sp.]